MSFKVVIVIPRGPCPEELLDEVASLGVDCKQYHEADTPEELLSICRDADYIITGTVSFKFNPYILNGLTKCRFIQIASVGYDGIDIDLAAKLGIGVMNLSSFCAEELAEHAFALILGCARWIMGLYKRGKAGNTVPPASKEAISHMSILRGKTLGLIGLGSSGKLMLPKARGFNMKILAYDPYVEKELFTQDSVNFVEIDRLIKESDYISIHANLTAETYHLINMEKLKLMKPGAIVVNVARGAIIDEKALISALSEKYIAGAGLDVTETEPLPLNSPLWELDNVILTGHNAGASPESDRERVNLIIEELKRVLRGEWPVRLINQDVKQKYIEKWGKMS